LKLVPIFYSATDITQNVTWSSSNTSIATINVNTGTVTGISAGPVVITASKVIAGTSTTVIESYFLLVTKYSLTFGFSTDDYVDGCQYGNRGSTYYANVAYNNFIIDPAYTSIFEKYRIAHSNSNNYNDPIASRNDFLSMANDVDFMFYIGHGIAADRGGISPNQNDRTKGNFLHYNLDEYGNGHSGHNNCEGDQFNYYTSEARFGGSHSRLRWVFLFTCNFLNENSYVNETQLKMMMNGAHIVMGYSTQAYLNADSCSRFSAELQDECIINAFFIAGDQEESRHASDNHIQKAFYMNGARYETIYSEPVNYGKYGTGTVYYITNGIHDSIIYS